MQNQVDYKNGADIETAPDVESELLFGKGRAYGAELKKEKAFGQDGSHIPCLVQSEKLKASMKINGIMLNKIVHMTLP